MGRKPKGEQSMTNAERQRAYRERHRPQTRAEEFLAKASALYGLYSLYMTPEEMEEALDQLARLVTWRWKIDTYRQTADYKRKRAAEGCESPADPEEAKQRIERLRELLADSE